MSIAITASPFERLQAACPDAEIWWDAPPQIFDAVAREILAKAPDSGSRMRWQKQLERLFDPANPESSLVRGVTTNPSIISEWIRTNPGFWRGLIQQIHAGQILPSVETTTQLVYQKAIAMVAETMMPLWQASAGRHGWVSGQTDPRLMFDVPAMENQARRIAELGPNVMLKIPGTREGYEVIKRLTAEGISTNSTLSFTVPQFVACMDAVEEGLALAHMRGVDLTRWRSVITHMIGRFGAMNDLHEEAADRGIVLSQGDIRFAEVEIAKKACRLLRERRHPSKMLLSSLLCDTAATESDVASEASSMSVHLEHTAGAPIAYTCKPSFVSDVIRRQQEFPRLDPGAWQRSIPAAAAERLSHLPTFRHALSEKGIAPERFSSTGAFLGTFKEVNDNIRKLIRFVELQLEARDVPARLPETSIEKVA